MSLPALFDVLLNNLLPVFLTAATGFLLGKTLRPDIKSVSRVAFYIFSPCLVFKSIVGSKLTGDELGLMAFFTIAAILLSGALALGVARMLRYPRPVAAAVILSVMFVNGGNFGLPLNLYAFGEAGLARAVLYFVFSTLMVYTLGVFVAGNGTLSATGALRSVLRVPAVYALPLAGVVQFSGWTLPPSLQRPIDLLGTAAIPTMLVILGLQLARARLGERPGPVGVVTGLRLLAGPLIGLALAWLMGLTGPLRQAAVLESAMPTAVITTILAVAFDAQPELVTGAVLVTTLLSPLTLTPLLLFLKA